MECFSCRGQLKRGKTNYTINRQGYHLIMDAVPAWICQQCGEVLFEEKSVNAIQGLIQEASDRDTTPHCG